MTAEKLAEAGGKGRRKKGFLRVSSPAQRAAVDEAFRVGNRRAVGLAVKIVGDPITAEDVTQDAWVSLLTANTPTHPSYISQTVSNSALSEIRRRKTRNRYGDIPLQDISIEEVTIYLPGSEIASASETAALRHEVENVFSAIGKLPSQYRDVLLLAAQEMNYVEIARELGISVNTARRRVCAGRQKLLERL